MFGHRHGILFVEDGQVGQDAVRGRRTQGDQRPARRRTVDPAAEECTGHALADAKAGDGRSDGDDFTGAIR